MIKSLFILFAAGCIVQTAVAQVQKTFTTLYGNNPAAGKYATVNGIQMYYETCGQGAPMVLVHGNGGSVASKANQIEYF